MDSFDKIVYTQNSKKYFNTKKILDIVFIPIFSTIFLASMFFFVYLLVVKVYDFSIYLSLGFSLILNSLYILLCAKELIKIKTVKIVIESSGEFAIKYANPIKKHEKLSAISIFNIVLVALVFLALILNIVFVSIAFSWELLIGAIFVFALFAFSAYIMLTTIVVEKMNKEAINKMNEINVE